MSALPRDVVDALFPADLPEPAHWQERYPPRDLPERAYVTRFGPSPTGFVHIGGIYAATISRELAHTTGGVYFVRVEDTDRRREVAGAREQFARAFRAFDVEPDEGEPDGAYGPYDQSRRDAIYATYARELLRSGRAYPCFCTREELAALAEEQRAAAVPPGYHGRWARCRHLSEGDAVERLRRGDEYTIRFRAPDGEPGRVSFSDAIRGELEAPENRNDAVVLKSSLDEPRLPTYHFAHVVDDTLMRVNLVVRGEEWLSSVPLHLQLFEAVGFEPTPYAHIAPLMKTEGSSRRKLSKRKDPEASVDFYLSEGYPAGAVLRYLRGLANSEIANAEPPEAGDAIPIRLEAMGVAGPLVDLVKLESVSREWIGAMSAAEVYEEVLAWAREHRPPLVELLARERDLAVAALAVEREGAENPRKDLARWADFEEVYGFFFPELLPAVDPADGRLAPLDPDTVRALAGEFAERYEHDRPAETWFDQVRELAAEHRFAPSAKEFKQDPDRYVGSIREASNVIRVALTGATRSPDLHEVSRVLGRDEVVRRARALAGR